MPEIIHFEGKYHDVTFKLAQLEYPDLVDFSRLELNKDDYYRTHGIYELLAQPEYRELVDFSRLERSKDDYYKIH
jgi:hypothetical protein